MEIFKDTAQALRFAFTLEQYPGDATSSGNALHMALHDTGVPYEVVREGPSPERLREQAAALLLALRGNLIASERAALTATYSRNWDDKRGAVEQLQNLFYPHLQRHLADRRVVDKLVTRHYIAVRDRGNGWTVREISAQFGVARDRLLAGIAVIDDTARDLERLALAHLGKFINYRAEAAHA
jgi:hypothetical protein